MKTFPLLKIFPLNIHSFGKLPEEGHWDETMFPTIKYVVFYTSTSAMKIPFIIRRLVLSEYRLVYYGACYCCCFTTPHLYKIIFQLFFSLSCYIYIFFRLGFFFCCMVCRKNCWAMPAQKYVYMYMLYVCICVWIKL